MEDLQNSGWVKLIMGVIAVVLLISFLGGMINPISDYVEPEYEYVYFSTLDNSTGSFYFSYALNNEEFSKIVNAYNNNNEVTFFITRKDSTDLATLENSTFITVTKSLLQVYNEDSFSIFGEDEETYFYMSYNHANEDVTISDEGGYVNIFDGFYITIVIRIKTN
jgi:succinate-acetate transporter protein